MPPTPVKAIPDDYSPVTPYLFINGATQALDFYKKVFDAVERMRMPGPDNTIGHAEILINGALIMLADECPASHARSPQAIGGTPVMIHLYVNDVDAVVKKAVDAGAKLLESVQDKFYGDRSGSFLDPFGHMWCIATHKEDLSEEEMRKRLAALSKGAG